MSAASLFRHVVVGLSCLLLGVVSTACGEPTAEDEAQTEAASEDELVATFDRNGNIDLNRRTHILLVGDSDQLGTQPLGSAAARARRFAQLYPNDQLVLFVTRDVTDRDLAQKGAVAVQTEAFGQVQLADLQKLSNTNLIRALDRFKKIASIDFYGHSSPFGLLLEAEGDGRVLSASLPGNTNILRDNFERAANPFVTLNGCNGGVYTAPQLSRIWQVPVSGAFAATNFQELMNDGHFYIGDQNFYPPNLSRASKNNVSFGSSHQPTCASTGACMRMRPDNAPYYGIWSNQDTGMQYGLNYFKFFCDFNDEAACQKGMASSLYAVVGDHPVDAKSSKSEIREALADLFCTRDKDPSWFDQCKAGLFDSVDRGTAFSPMKTRNDYALECDMRRCEQEFRCTMVDGVPQKKSCAWVAAGCPRDAATSECRVKNTKKRTTANEFAMYLDGHKKLGGGGWWPF